MSSHATLPVPGLEASVTFLVRHGNCSSRDELTTNGKRVLTSTARYMLDRLTILGLPCGDIKFKSSQYLRTYRTAGYIAEIMEIEPESVEPLLGVGAFKESKGLEVMKYLLDNIRVSCFVSHLEDLQHLDEASRFILGDQKLPTGEGSCVEVHKNASRLLIPVSCFNGGNLETTVLVNPSTPQ